MNNKSLRIVRYGALGLAAVVAFGLLAVGLGWLQLARSPSAVPAEGGPVIAAFKLVDQSNKPVSEGDVRGRPAVVFFGFTNCPDVCPTTLAALTANLNRIGLSADRLGIFFVTVDPDRDTPDVLAAYLSPFDRRIRGLTGAPDQISTLAKSLGVYFARSEIAGGGYTMDHTASVILLDAEGRFAGTIAFGENNDTALEKLRLLVRD